MYNPLDNLDEALDNDFKFWSITDNGDICRPDRSEIQIQASELLDVNWLSHIIGKGRVPDSKNAESEFYFVFMEALHRAGYKRIMLDVENIHAPIIGEK